jgi:hypothetical protein
MQDIGINSDICGVRENVIKPLAFQGYQAKGGWIGWEEEGGEGDSGALKKR